MNTKKPYSGSYKSGEKRNDSYSDRKNQGEKKQYGASGEYKKSYSRDGAAGKSYGESKIGGNGKSYGSQKPFRKDYGDKPRSFHKDDGERKPFHKDGDFGGKPFRKDYGDKPRSFHKDDGEKKPYFHKGASDNRSYPYKGNAGKSFGAKSEKPVTKREYADDARSDEDVSNGAIPGRNAVRELLKSGRDIEKIFVRQGDREGSITVLVAESIARGIPVIEVEKAKLDTLCNYEQHQGIVAIASEKEYVAVEDILKIAEDRGEKPLIIICDGVSDPHNLGAVIRCAEGAGAHGIVIPKRRAAGITPAVVKASAGAVEYLAAAKCSNVADVIRKLKAMGIWIFGAEAGGEDYTKAALDVPCAIVLGSEENGISDVVKKLCDHIISIPMRGKVNSLNVSTAAAVLLYEALQCRATGSEKGE